MPNRVVPGGIEGAGLRFAVWVELSGAPDPGASEGTGSDGVPLASASGGDEASSLDLFLASPADFSAGLTGLTGFWSSAAGSSTVTAEVGGGDCGCGGFIGSGEGEGGEVVTAVELGSAATGPNTFSSGLSRVLRSATWPDKSRTTAFSPLISLSLASFACTSASVWSADIADAPGAGAATGPPSAEVARVAAVLAAAESVLFA